MIPIKGMLKLSLVDFAPHPACVVFVGGCNFRCPNCQNADLVLQPGKLPDIPVSDILKHLDSRKGWLDGLVVTGGEPLLYDLVPLLSEVKKRGLLVKVDTNGTTPDILKELIDAKLVDYVAMDIKAPLEKYDSAAKAKVDTKKISESVQLLLKGLVDYEFRTTVVPDFYSEQDAHEVGAWLKGCKRYALQQFRTEMGTIDPNLRTVYPKEKLFEFQRILQGYIPEVLVRNV
jgi:pyruvate formate lyase activating enzyme